MQDPNLNFARGALDGLSTGLDLIDRNDARKRRKRLEQRDDLLFAQSQQDRERTLTRNAELEERSDLVFDQQQEDRDYALERRQVEDKHRDALMPVERQAARTRLATAETEQRFAEQKARNQEVLSIWSEASTLFDGGEFEAAEKSMAKLANYGYDVESMSTGVAQEASDIAEQFINGQIDYSSPQLEKLANWVLKPSLVQSGRDPERFSIKGIVPTGEIDEDGTPTFMITMMDSETGKPVPVTLNKTTAADNDPNDPVMEVSARDLMSATQGFINASTASTQVRMRAIGASLGQKAYSQALTGKEKLEEQKIQAEIEKIKAQTAEIKGSDGGDGASPNSDGMKRLFASSYESMPRLEKISELLQENPNFDFESGIKAMAEIKALANDEKYQTLGAGELYQVYTAKKSIERDVVNISGEKITNFVSQYPNLSEKDKEYAAQRIVTLVKQFKDSKINEVQLSGRIQDLHERMSKKVELSPAEQAKRQSERALPIGQREGSMATTSDLRRRVMESYE